jgi:hypothetical protein
VVDTERETLQPLFTMIKRYKLGAAVELHKRTLQQGLVSLIGPRAREVAGADGLPATEHANARAEVDGIPVLLVATDVGVDVVTDAERTQEVTEALRARGARDVAEGAAEALRVQRGRPRFGRDMDESTIPQEAGSTSVLFRSPRAAMSARRPSPASTTAGSPTATCAAWSSPARRRPEPRCAWATRSLAGWAPSRGSGRSRSCAARPSPERP